VSGGKAAAGAGFSTAEQIKMQQEMVNQALRYQKQSEDRAAVNASKMPAVTILQGNHNIPEVTGPPRALRGKNLKPLNGVPFLSDSLSKTSRAPKVSEASSAPGVKAAPKLPPPSEMPVRDKESLLAEKKLAAKQAAARSGRASTILSR
jgi:hypothetical protein